METGDNALVQDGEVPPPLPMDINNRQDGKETRLRILSAPDIPCATTRPSLL